MRGDIYIFTKIDENHNEDLVFGVEPYNIEKFGQLEKEWEIKDIYMTDSKAIISLEINK